MRLYLVIKKNIVIYMSDKNPNEITDYFQLRKGNKVKALKVDKSNEKPIEKIDDKSDLGNSSGTQDNITELNSDSEEFESGSDNKSLYSEIDSVIVLADDSGKSDTEIDDKTSRYNLNIKNNLDLKMAKKDLNMSQALKFISTFDGNSANLHQFLECSDIIFEELKDTEHPKFLLLMKRLLTGSAYNETVKHNTYESWELLKADLKLRFTDIRSKLQVSQELNTVSQKNNEDVRTYGSRVKLLLCQLNDICITETGRGSEQIIESLNSQTALISFQEGLNKNIRILVKAANCKTLKDSIAKAVEEELLWERHTSLQNNLKPKCQFCHKVGHVTEKCFRLQNSNKNNPKNISYSSHQSSETKPTSSNQASHVNSRKIQCQYCKKMGHHIDNCFSRKNAEARKEKNNTSEKNKSVTLNENNSEKLNIINLKRENSGNSSRLDQFSSNRAVRAKDLM